MSSELNVAPPELPQMMAGGELLSYMQKSYPDRAVVDEALMSVAAIMDEYNRIRAAYCERSALFVKQVQRYSANPQEKEGLMSIADEHEGRLRAAQETLDRFDEAVNQWEKRWGSSGIRDTVKQILVQTAADVHRFGESLQRVRDSSGPLSLNATAGQGAVPGRALPQKRARV